MIASIEPHQADAREYAYASGAFSARRSLLLPVQELRHASETGETGSLVPALNRSAYAPVTSDMSPGDILARVESTWLAFLARAARDLPEGFLPFLLAALDEKEYAKAGLAQALLGGTDGSLTGATSGEYAVYCKRIQKAGNSAEVLAESVFGVALSHGLKAAEAGASTSDAQTVFDFSFQDTLGGLARAYGNPAVIGYVERLRRLMLSGHALKMKLRGGSGIGAPLQRLLPFVEPDIQVTLVSISEHIQDISWDTLQPADLVPEASAYVLPVGRHYTADERIDMLEDALGSWLVGRPEEASAEPYGVAVVFAYLMDFRREVWALRRLFKAAAAMELGEGNPGGAL
ncbi:MAG: hypothetical protein ABFD13_01535 [Candidatus Cryosericum sp.]|nr:hypothetical protein [bacterium]